MLGYSDEMGGGPKTVPEVLGRNGTYVVFRKLHERVATFRRYLKEKSKGPEDEELTAAKMMGRGAAAPPGRSARFAMTRNWAQTRCATTTSFFGRTIRTGSRRLPARTYGAQIHATQR